MIVGQVCDTIARAIGGAKKSSPGDFAPYLNAGRRPPRPKTPEENMRVMAQHRAAMQRNR